MSALKILVVANPGDQAELVSLLRAAGAPLADARLIHGVGDDATFARFEAERPAIAIVAASLERGDAASLIAAMREHAAPAALFVVVIGDARGPVMNALDAIDLGADRFVSRPLSVKALRFAVMSGLGAAAAFGESSPAVSVQSLAAAAQAAPLADRRTVKVTATGAAPSAQVAPAASPSPASSAQVAPAASPSPASSGSIPVAELRARWAALAEQLDDTPDDELDDGEPAVGGSPSGGSVAEAAPVDLPWAGEVDDGESGEIQVVELAEAADGELEDGELAGAGAVTDGDGEGGVVPVTDDEVIDELELAVEAVAVAGEIGGSAPAMVARVETPTSLPRDSLAASVLAALERGGAGEDGGAAAVPVEVVVRETTSVLVMADSEGWPPEDELVEDAWHDVDPGPSRPAAPAASPVAEVPVREPVAALASSPTAEVPVREPTLILTDEPPPMPAGPLPSAAAPFTSPSFAAPVLPPAAAVAVPPLTAAPAPVAATSSAPSPAPAGALSSPSLPPVRLPRAVTIPPPLTPLRPPAPVAVAPAVAAPVEDDDGGDELPFADELDGVEELDGAGAFAADSFAADSFAADSFAADSFAADSFAGPDGDTPRPVVTPAPAARPGEPPPAGGEFARELRRKMSAMAERLFRGEPPVPVASGPGHDHHTEIDLRALDDDGGLAGAALSDDLGAPTYVGEVAAPEPQGTDRGTAEVGELRRGGPDVPALVARMFAQSFTGRVVFRRGAVEKAIHFDGGRPVFATSNQSHDRMGELLHREGKITREQHDRCRELVRDTGRRMGEILVERGYLKRRELLPAVRRHIEDIIYSLFGWDSGEYRVVAGDGAGNERIRLARHAAAILLEGVRRKLGHDLLEPLLGPPGTVVTIADRDKLAAVTAVADLSREERAALSALDGVADLDQVARASGAGLETVYQLAWSLALLGLVAPRRRDDDGDTGGLIGESDLRIDRERVRARAELCADADYFALLGVRRDATGFEIRRAYEAARRDFAPESFPPELRRELAADLDDIAAVLDEAFRVLRDDPLRTAYRSHLLEPAMESA